MRKHAFIIVFTCLSVFQLFGQPTAIEKNLFLLPDVIFEEIETPNNYLAAYKLYVRQPLDHNNPDKGSFYQKVFLSHRGFDRPSVIITEGYDRNQNRIYELTELLQGNQIQIEHRFFGESIPDSLDYSYLTLEQATADIHHINQLMRKIYTGKWISTGISKGGQTTIYYRYFYPNDVDVSVPYVAPLNLSLEDERIYNFLDTVGSDACRDAIYSVQKRLLKNRNKVLPLIEWYVKGANLSFTYLDFEQAFEYAVLEYPFSFWQWGSDCADIPGKSASPEDLAEHLLSVSGLDFFADQSMKAYASHYYQAGSQMGYYGYDVSKFKGLIKALPSDKNPLATFMPDKMPMTFDGRLPKQVNEWLKTEGNNFIYIYGNSDTWSATAVLPSKNTNSVWFFMPNRDHGAARIRNMSEEEFSLLVDTLENWLDMDIR